ncbi:MAG TPA: flagellar biosynthesis anti-sigma factor FlgM [Terriglobales bacterium]|nr:flagellar biosynthesis anti-sigma factor FlgM [Terriglobales bacterium]
MRINANNPLSNPLVSESSAKSAKSSPASAASSGDGASFSANAGGMDALEASVLATPEIRQDRVAALREALRSGSYQTDPSQIAEAMLREAAS